MTEVENIKVSIRVLNVLCVHEFEEIPDWDMGMQVRPLNRREEESKEKEAWRVVDGSSIVPTEHNPRQGTGNTYTYGRFHATNTERCRFFADMTLLFNRPCFRLPHDDAGRL
jgi:hypothetical protein